MRSNHCTVREVMELFVNEDPGLENHGVGDPGGKMLERLGQVIGTKQQELSVRDMRGSPKNFKVDCRKQGTGLGQFVPCTI